MVKKDSYLAVFYIFFIGILIYIFFRQIAIGCYRKSWQINEWLINYQGGFVRRGLWGELILNLYKNFGLNSYVVIISFCVGIYLGFLLVFIKLYTNKGYPLFILPFVFFLGNPIVNNFWVRKDVLLVAIFAVILFFSNKKIIIRVIGVNLFFILGLLTHESIGFFALPIIFLIFYKNNFYKLAYNKIKSSVLSLIQLLPTVVVFISCLYYKGSVEVSNAIWNSWKVIKFPIQVDDLSVPPAAIKGLSWSLSEGLQFTISNVHIFNFGIYAPIAWLLIVVAIYYLLTNLDEINIKKINYSKQIYFNKNSFSNVLIFQLLSIGPLFILGCDYGRWIFFWVISSFLIILLLPDKKISNLFPPVLSHLSFNINNFLSLKFSKYKNFLVFLVFFIGFHAVTFSLGIFLASTPFGIILRTILPSSIVSYIKILVL